MSPTDQLVLRQFHVYGILLTDAKITRFKQNKQLI